MTIRKNIEAWLAHYGVTGVEIVEEREDRVFAKDTQGALLKKALIEHWDRSSGANHSLTEQGSTALSFREPDTPSLQIVVHEQYDARKGRADALLELDFDKHSPNESLAGHAAEVLRNKWSGGKTNQRDITEALIARGIRV